MTGTSTARRRLLGAGAGLWLAGCASGTPPSLRTAPPAALPGSHQLDLRDPASGRTWRVWIQSPDGPAPAAGHPVLYVLDGNAAFALAAQLARNDAARPPGLRPDAAVVVGIGHPGDAVYHPAERQRDYTPAGGALLDFIDRELRPRVAAAFLVDPRRQTLSGHSFGGLFVLNTLFTRPAMFTRYAAASPSIWWDDARLLKTAAAFVSAHATAPRGFDAELLLQAGSRETAAAAATTERAAVQQERRVLERTRDLARHLAALHWPELRVRFTSIDGADHGGAMAPALAEALAFAQRG